MRVVKLNLDQNKCWFCKQNNLSRTTTCQCGAETVPAKNEQGKTTYRIYSFGCKSKDFPSCTRLPESLFDMTVEAIQDGTLVAIRVGSDSQSAILIKDTNGDVRSCVNIDSTLQKTIEAQFVQASRDILESHADRTAGKTMTFPITIHGSL
jgi:hypothetical protein